MRETALRNHKIWPIFLSADAEVDAIEAVTAHALLILGIRALIFTYCLLFIKMCSTAGFVTSIENLWNNYLPVSGQKHSRKIVVGVVMRGF